MSTPQPPDRQELVERTIRKLINRKKAVAGSVLQLLNAEIDSLYCDLAWLKDDPQDVERYDGTLGVTKEFVEKYSPAIGQLRWLEDLPQRYKGVGNSPGNVTGLRWGSGALIDNDLFLTAGHCFDAKYPAWHIPERNNAAILPEEMAKEMCVNFNYQLDRATGKVRLGIPYPVIGLLEKSRFPIDYAIIRLGRDAAGRLPGELFGKLTVAATDQTIRNTILCIIQHPGRREKKVEAGHLLELSGGRIAYNDIGTSGGASGAPILNGKTGEIVGVHTRGGSLPIGGFNSGTAIGAIRAVSKVIAGLKPSLPQRAVLSQVPAVEPHHGM